MIKYTRQTENHIVDLNFEWYTPLPCIDLFVLVRNCLRGSGAALPRFECVYPTYLSSSMVDNVTYSTGIVAVNFSDPICLWFVSRLNTTGKVQVAHQILSSKRNTLCWYSMDSRSDIRCPKCELSLNMRETRGSATPVACKPHDMKPCSYTTT